MKKKIISGVVIFLLLLACVPFLPPVYRNYTKPFVAAWWSRKEWYAEVDNANLDSVKRYCQKYGYNSEYYILVDFGIRSGRKRFFVYNLRDKNCVMSSYCLHGSGKGNTDAKPKFSNLPGSGCSSLGRYLMINKGYKKRLGNFVRLRGLDKTNYLAEGRGIYIHSASRVSRFHGESDYLSIGSESKGCFAISKDCMSKVLEICSKSSDKHPVLLFAKY